jgi:hypothetical protein
MEWINIKKQLPPLEEDQGRAEKEFILAFHTIHGIGVAWFWRFDEDEIERLEEEFGDKYVCSAEFIMNKTDGNYCIASEDDIDIFMHSPHFYNLGTITHWMLLPQPPIMDGYIQSMVDGKPYYYCAPQC